MNFLLAVAINQLDMKKLLFFAFCLVLGAKGFAQTPQTPQTAASKQQMQNELAVVKQDYKTKVAAARHDRTLTGPKRYALLKDYYYDELSHELSIERRYGLSESRNAWVQRHKADVDEAQRRHPYP